jgi:hypothetical protein
MKEEVEPNIYEDDFSFYNMNSIINFVKNNTIQIFLFLLVFIIIYIVDYISNINTMLMTIQQQQLTFNQQKILKKNISKNKSKK